MIASTSFVIVDLETTGFQPKLDHIIEIGAVKVVNGEIVGEWETLVNPGIYIPHDITNFTGIDTQMTQGAPRFAEVLPDFLEFMGEDSIFVAHNVDFDRNFLTEKLMVERGRGLEGPYLCTIKLAKRVYPQLGKYGLGALAKRFGVSLPQAHRALHDAKATALLFAHFMEQLQERGIEHVKDIPVIQNYVEPVLEVQEEQVSLF